MKEKKVLKKIQLMIDDEINQMVANYYYKNQNDQYEVEKFKWIIKISAGLLIKIKYYLQTDMMFNYILLLLFGMMRIRGNCGGVWMNSIFTIYILQIAFDVR